MVLTDSNLNGELFSIPARVSTDFVRARNLVCRMLYLD